MLKRSISVFISVLFIFLFYTIANLASPFKKERSYQQNTAPAVKIISPANNSIVTAGSLLHYSIAVSDKEDGESKYEEINPKEVLLEVTYNSNASTLIEALNKPVQKDAPGLAAIRTSNCFNCHGFDKKVIGPTFIQISKRYKPTASNMALLEKRIHDGSSGIWGKESMPTHPELSDEQIKNMVKWIMQDGPGSATHYYIGTEGSFSLKIPPAASNNGAYLLTASYTDHGINNTGQRLKGQDAIIIRIK